MYSLRWFPLLYLLFQLNSAIAGEPPCAAAAPCTVSGGDYHLAIPEDWDGVRALPAVLFFHGHRSSGEAVIRSDSLRTLFNQRGYLLIAPNGEPRGSKQVRGWPARINAHGRRDDIAFSLAVLDDVEQRLPLDRQRILVSGFSSGGSMAWHLACYQGARFAAFAPVAGALRRPVPTEKCPGGPVRLLHFHGFTDQHVPLEGRGIRDWHQGDVFESLALLRNTDACPSQPSRFETDSVYRCRIWENCGTPGEIRFCLHDGGHGLPPGWGQKTLDWFETYDRTQSEIEYSPRS